MKKLLDSKFLFILALSIVVLIILGVGAFYLFDDADDVFVKDGYILNPLSAKNEKYSFNKNTAYKENLSSMIVFNDAENNEVSIFKDSFIHYMDSSMSFLTNGAILDLGSISGSNAVKFYNITNKSIIAKSGDGYVIETNGEDINLKNFMGRISDNKYIVAGSLEAKIPGNEKNITGNYFEIVYNEEGVITIENSEVKYQVAAEGTYIYAGDVTIDLGNKKIVKGEEDVMSITAITINGDENIEIIPKAPDKENEEDGNGEGNDGNGENTNNVTDNTVNGQDGTGTANTDKQSDIKIDDLVVSLKDYEIHTKSITVVFDVINKREDDVLTLKLTNLETGKMMSQTYDVVEGQEIRIPELSPETKYLFSVVNERDESKYFQKIFKTKDLGISLEQTYVTSNEIGYKVTIDKDSEIKNADITFKKYSDEGDAGVVVETHKLSDYVGEDGTYRGINFSLLDSDTIYKIIVDNYVIGIASNKDAYALTKTTLTLKERPSVSIGREIKDDGFKIFVKDVVDKDKAIQNYTYYIFENEDDVSTSDFVFDYSKAIYKVTKESAEPVEIKLGENGIESGKNYIYMVSVEYYDNEKYIEEVREGRIDLFIGNDPFVTIQKNDDDISYDRISATITITDTDKNCLIAMEGRTCFDDYEEYPVVIDVKEIDTTGALRDVEGYPQKVSDFKEIGNTLVKKLDVTGLKEHTKYVITVSARRKDRPDDGIKELKHGALFENEIETKYLASFDAVWEDTGSTDEYAISGTFKLKERKNEYTISGDNAANLIERVVFRLYDGPYTGNLAGQTLLATSDTFVNTEDTKIKDIFYDNEFAITDMFPGLLEIDALKTRTAEKKVTEDSEITAEDKKLSPYYTIAAEVYYVNGSRAVVTPQQKHFAVAAHLHSDIDAPVLTKEELYKVKGDGFSSLLTSGEGGAVVGYTLHVNYAKAQYEDNRLTIKNIVINVYDDENNPVAFYTDDRGTIQSSPFTIDAKELNGTPHDVNIYMANGVENGTNMYIGDSANNEIIMSRGKKYHVRAEINYTLPETNRQDKQTSNTVELLAKKEAPKIKEMFIAETTKTGEVTYKYKIADIDNAWYRENDEYNIYYSINNGEEKKTPIVKNLEELDTFKITGLSKGNGYTLSYKRNEYDTGDALTDVSSLKIGNENRLFDGYYDAKDSEYNFKYQVISDPLHDNKVTVKMLMTDNLLNKVLMYNVKFEDTKGNVHEEKIWNLVKCEDDTDDKNRCFEVEYTKLDKKGMKSEGNEKNYITVSIEAIYDNGLTGFNYIDKIGENKEYPYMIFQDDSTVEKMGDYIIVNNRSPYHIAGSGTRKMPLGYYTFSFLNNDIYDDIKYQSKYVIGDEFPFTTQSYVLDSRGYYVDGLGVLNPKMVSIDNMTGVDNRFYFSSITPMVNIDKTISLINGARVMMTLSGADIDDFCAVSDTDACVKNGEKKIYVQVLDEDTLDTVNKDNKISEGLIPTVEVTLNDDEDDINSQYVYDILNLAHDTKYYFRVYTYLNDGGTKKLTEIFNKVSKNKPETYKFNSKKLYSIDENDKDKLLDSVQVVYQPIENGSYNDRELVTTISLNSYDTESNVPYNFNVSYEFCKSALCDEEDSRVFSENIGETTKIMSSSHDITNDDIEFNKTYYTYIYMTYDYYDKNVGDVVPRTVAVYEESSQAEVPIAPLEPLKFTVYRDADYISTDGYVVDITVNIDDDDRILSDGKFFVKLLDGDQVVGKLMLKGEDGIYRQVSETGAYDTYPLEADENKEGHNVNEKIRIAGLNENTSYTVVVYGNVHMKNNGLDEYDFEVRSGKDGKGDIVWTTNNYGVAFGAVTYTPVSKGFIVRYGAGSNVDTAHIKAIEVDVKENGRPFYNKTIQIGEDNKYLEADEMTGRYRFVVRYDDEDLANSLPPTYYTITTRYEVLDPTTGSTIWIREAKEGYYRALSQDVSYDPNEIIED